MISIIPTTTSALSAATYRVDLPGEINPVRPRSQKITTTLDGGAAVTTWKKNNAGATQSVQLTIAEDKYRALLAIVNHATVYQWVAICDGRQYICTIDTETPVSVTVGGLPYKQLNVTFVIIEDKNT